MQFGNIILDEESILLQAGARYYSPPLGNTTSTDPHAIKYPHLSSYSWCGNNPIMNVDKNGKDFRLVKTTNDDGSTQLTAQTTIHIYGSSASESTAQYMQNAYKNMNSNVAVDNNTNLTFDISVQYHATMESAMQATTNNAGDNMLEIATPFSSDYNLYNANTSNGEAKETSMRQLGGQTIAGGREGKALNMKTAFHEIGHFLGLGERYTLNKNYAITNKGFENDIMGNNYPNSISPIHYQNLYNFVKDDVNNSGNNVVIPYRDIGNIPE
jgi:RHS repeat-associated protein